MKRYSAPAAALAIVAALVLGRSLFVTAQQPIGVGLPPAFPNAPSLPEPGSSPFIPQATPGVSAPKDAAAASLPELVELLKGVRQQKAELQRKEEQITATIRKKIEEEKKLHDEVLQLIGAPNGNAPKGNGVSDPKINIEDRNTLPK